MNLFANQSYDIKIDAQCNLQGRTHYVDDATLRYHKARIIDASVHAQGLLFLLVESVARDSENTRRGFRFVIFDLFGFILARPDLENTFRTVTQARKALGITLAGIDAKAHTLAVIGEAEIARAREMEELRARVEKLGPIT